ncbi:hypothetical protein [Bacillus pumilus]
MTKFECSTSLKEAFVVEIKRDVKIKQMAQKSTKSDCFIHSPTP